MMIENIRLSTKAKTQLTTLKRRTGIKQWNTLCRWAFCLSMSDAHDPPKQDSGEPSNVEMTWKTFGGAEAPIYAALLAFRRSKSPASHKELSEYEYFLLHLNRGISRLLNDVGSVSDLVKLPLKST